MSPKVTPKCVQCEKTESIMWRIIETGEICNDCYEHNKNNLKNELEPNTAEAINQTEEKKVRKSTRSTRYKAKYGTNNTNKNIPKGKSRRNIFKKTPFKAPTVGTTTTTAESLFFNGLYFQIGDIVSLMNKEDNIYYAQIKGLLQDNFCEKSAILTWLIPTKSSPPPNESFDPSTYLIGPEEEFPRKLACMEFVMHAPSSYYHCKDTPYPIPDIFDDHSKMTPNGGFIWTNIGGI